MPGQYKSYALIVEPLTPIHVGGFSAGPGLDIVVQDDRGTRYWCLVDIEDVGLLPNSEIKKIIESSSYNVIKDIVRNFIRQGKCKYRIKDKSKKLGHSSIKNEILLLPRPWLIPASTIKGVIRTLILENIILKLDYKDVKNLLDKIKDNIQNIKSYRNVKDIALKTVENSLLRVTKDNRNIDLLQKLQVSEPIIEDELTYIGESIVIKRSGNIVGTSLTEFIEKGRFYYNIRMFKYPLITDFISKSNEKIKHIQICNDADNILDSIKQIYKQILEKDEDRLNKLNVLDYNFKLEDHGKLYRSLKDMMEEPGCIPFRVGRFAGHMWKTVWPALIYKQPDYAQQVYRKLSLVMATRVSRKKVWDSLTVKLACRYGRCVEAGWARLCLKKM